MPQNQIIHDTVRTLMVQVPLQKDWSDYLPALTAFAAVLIGPIIQWMIARRQTETTLNTTELQVKTSKESLTRQIRANAAVALRQNRIDQIRALAANYLEQLGGLSTLMFGTKGHLTTEHQVTFIDFTQRLVSLQHRIEVMLDESEEHAKLFTLMQEFYIVARTTTSREGADQFEAKRKEFVAYIRKVISKEYDSLQSGE